MGYQQPARRSNGDRRYTNVLGEVGDVLDRLLTASDQVDANLRAFHAELAESRQVLDALQTQVNQLNQRYTELLSRVHERNNPDALVASKRLEHETFADELDRLIEDVWREIHSAYEPGGHSARAKAEAMTFVIRMLLSPPISVPPQYRQDARLMALLENFQQRGRNLMLSVQGLGSANVLDFSVNGDTAIDPEFQDVWRGGNPDGRVMFAVTPAYRVGSQILRRQHVYTRNADDDTVGTETCVTE